MIWPEELMIFTLVSRCTMDWLVAGASVVLSLEKGLDHDTLMPSLTMRNSHHRGEPNWMDSPMAG